MSLRRLEPTARPRHAVAVDAPPSSRLVAHRGWTRRYPENTGAAVRGALEVGAEWVEVDVQLAADRVPHLFHDRTLARMTGARGALHELDSAALSGLRASEPGRFGARFAEEPVAELEGCVELVRAAPGAQLFVELKRCSIEVFGAEAVLDAVLPRLAPLEDRAWLISFDLGVLARARARCGLRLGPVLEDWGQLESTPVRALAPEVVFCNVLRLPAAGGLELESGALAVYEIDEPERARELFARGAGWIETFAVGELLEALRAVEEAG